MSAHAAAAPNVSLRRFAPESACDEHDFHQVVLGFEGAMDMIVDGIGQRIDHRHAWLVPAGARHEYAGVGSNRQLVLDLPPASLAIPERLFARPCVFTLDDGLAALVKDIAAHGEAARWPLDGLPADPAPTTLRERLFAWQAGTQLARTLAAANGIDAPNVGLDFRRIDNWLRAHLSEPLRVEDLATHCSFGVRRFHQLFVEAFGVTPHRYLQRLRLDAGLALLREPRHTIADVALAVGFGDQSAFTHAFTKRFGLAPGQWRSMRAH